MYVKVILNTKTLDLNRTFDYKVPQHLKQKVVLGSRVFVPFGRGNSKRDAFVIDIIKSSKYATKEILEVLTGELLSESRIRLAKIMSKRYFCNLSSAIKLMLNPGNRKSSDSIMKKLEEKYIVFNYLTKEEIDKCLKEKEEKNNKVIRITEKQEKVLEYARKYFKKQEQEKDKQKIKEIKQKGKEEKQKEKEKKQEKIKLEIKETDILENVDVSVSILNTMIKNGIIKRVYKEKEVEGYIFKPEKADEKKVLNKEQNLAYKRIVESVSKGEYKEYLLHGITGSGKTEIYLQAIEYVLSLNKTAIILVPEISLTPQIIKRFTSRFGEDNLAILHSGLTDRERFEEWIRIEREEVNIVIGTRSAVFAPIKNLGIIIIDEEHDGSYRSEITPRYHATEIARYFAKTENIILLLRFSNTVN